MPPNIYRKKICINDVLLQITLLAGTLVSLTSILGGTDANPDKTTRGWSAFRVILWTAIMSDVGEAFVCLMAIKMCTELPLVAMEKQMELLETGANAPPPPPRPRPPHSAGSEHNPPEHNGESEGPTRVGLKELQDRHAILEAVGMPRFYQLVDRLVIWFLVFSSTTSFLTMFFWVCQTVILIPAMLILISFVIIVAIVLGIFVIAVRFGRNWS